MKFILLPHVADPRKPEHVQLAEIVELGVFAEQLGFDGFGVGERHDRPALSSSPAVILSNLAARTSTIRLFTAITALGLHDPLRAYEDYATLDNLAQGRLDLIIGKGAYTTTQRLFGVTTDDQWHRLQENYDLFRRLWTQDSVTWAGRFRPALGNAEALPRPFQPRLRIWHGSATNPQSADFAARHGDPIFSSNGGVGINRYVGLIEHYREQFAAYGHDPAEALVGIGTAGYFGARTTREAVEKYRPVFQARLAVNHKYDGATIGGSLEEWIEHSSVLVGTPQQIIEKIHAQHERFGHEVFHIHVDAEILHRRDYLDTLELFFTEIAPVIRKDLPGRTLDWV
ncbi:LLM class flavin-dependent oxidoreductase [Jiangella endophytica]|uniref:LLM class flavin-dependent oxidoreductase n=1 Tax=Jiangella endophytica TaxID=1623398 RepID=UPI000E342073|nr:LLM class flavin-dependent oxidoreductase [Jiangella endophytica]